MWGKRGYQRLVRLGFGKRETPESEMDEEIETHLELRIADLMRAGLTPAQARAEAVRRFTPDDLATARRRLRAGARRRTAAREGRERLSSILSDLRLAIRQARRTPSFTAVAILTFGLGIGATTATFTLVNSVLLRPLPFPDAGRLVALTSIDSLRREIAVVSSANWLDWRRDSRTLASSAIHWSRRLAVVQDGTPVRVSSEVVSADFFAVLRPSFVAGRPMTAAEVAAGEPVVVVSESFWRRVLGGDVALGTRLTIESRSYRVVGVVKRGQEFPAEAELWLPIHFLPETGAARNNINWLGIGRLAPGATVAGARAELSTIAARIRASDPAALYSYGVAVKSLQSMVIGDSDRSLSLLMGAVVLVLLVACANLAAAHLARGLVRTKEMAVRAALGAGRARLTRQILVEHALLGGAGGLLGIGLATVGVAGVLRLWGDRIPRAAEVHVDGWVLGFGIIVSLIAGVGTGLAPAAQASRPMLAGLIAAGGRGAVQGAKALPGALLLVAEVALALLLLTGAGLLIRSFQVIQSRELGFDTNVVTVTAALSGERLRSDSTLRIAYWDRLTEALAALPGAKGAGVSNWVPLGFAGTGNVDVEAGNVPPGGVGYRAVSEGYLAALGVPLLAGRGFGPQDVPNGGRVVLVNRRAAELCWPGRSPIGRRIRAASFEAFRGGPQPAWLTVIGVVGDLRQWGPDLEPWPEMYVLFRQIPYYAAAMTAVVRVEGPADRMTSVARETARRVDPSVAVEVGTLDRDLATRLSPRRLTTSLLTGFGGFALALTAIGLYGLLSYSVSRRTRELALRAALGARRGHLVRIVALRAAALVLAGAAIGIGAAMALTRFMEVLLVDVTPVDPATFATALAVLLVVAGLAILIPALRATRLDPASALQAD